MKATLSEEVSILYPGMRFAIVQGDVGSPEFEQKTEALSRDFRPVLMEREVEIRESIKYFDDFFKSEGHSGPLLGQFSSAKKKGLPPVPPLVKALLYSEMTTGVLMGIQDGDKVEGELLLDLAQEGEEFVGMRGKIDCRRDEVVVRDGAGIVASFFQGPDKKTQVEARTTCAVFYVFSTPNLPERTFVSAIETVQDFFPRDSEVVLCGQGPAV
jgi:hypothetical protein